MLPLNQALKLPILVNGKTKIYRVSKGCIEFPDGIRTGFLTFGISSTEYSYSKPCFLRIDGKLIIKGWGNHGFGPGAIIFITPTGQLEINDNFSVDFGSRWIISGHSSIGKNNMYSWHEILLDTDAHAIYDENGERINNPRGFHIGDNVWIGARSTILKGVHIASGSVVATGSIVSKNLEIPNAIYVQNKPVRKKIKWRHPVDNELNVRIDKPL